MYQDHVLKLISYFNEAHPITIQHLDEPTYCLVIKAKTDGKPWFNNIKRYLEKEEYPADASIINNKTLRKLSTNFSLSGDVLYKRNFDTVMLRCMDRHRANMLIK